jgi:hypothetical protein
MFKNSGSTIQKNFRIQYSATRYSDEVKEYKRTRVHSGRPVECVEVLEGECEETGHQEQAVCQAAGNQAQMPPNQMLQNYLVPTAVANFKKAAINQLTGM